MEFVSPPSEPPPLSRAKNPNPKDSPPKYISAKDFFKNNPLKPSSASKSSPPKKTSPTQKRLKNLDSVKKEIERQLKALPQDSSEKNQGSLKKNHWRIYINTLRKSLQEQWRLDSILTHEKNFAKIRLHINSQGQISKTELVDYFGSPFFLKSIQQAIQSTDGIGPTPDRKSTIIEFTFRPIYNSLH